jgi:hypothetical protein
LVKYARYSIPRVRVIPTSHRLFRLVMIFEGKGYGA